MKNIHNFYKRHYAQFIRNIMVYDIYVINCTGDIKQYHASRAHQCPLVQLVLKH